MSAFTGPLTLTHLDTDWREWRLEQILRYEVGELGSGVFIDVPVGFTTDGASVPWPLWAIMPAWGSYSRAAVVHDYLYRMLRAGTPLSAAKSRREADAIFLEAMKVCGTGRMIRTVMWAIVRVFGRA